MNKVIVITGASSGIGRAAARIFADRGDMVYDLSRTEKPQEGVTHVACDVTHTESVKQAIAAVREASGRIDILILCAGFGVAGALEFTTDAEMHQQYEVNVFGTLRVVREALPLMRTQEKKGRERGRIVFVGSIAGIFAIPYQSMYSATKAAIHSYTFSLANEVKHYDLKVTCLMPGDVKTGFTAARKTDLKGLDAYPHMQASIEQMERDEQSGMPAEACARQLVRAALCRRNKPYHTMNTVSWIEKMTNRLFPSEVCRKVVGMMYHA